MNFRFFAVIAVGLIAPLARAQVVQFTNKASWQSAVSGSYSTIDFTGFPHDTNITDQYAQFGIAFSGVNLISGPTPGFANDSWGLFGPAGILFTFDSPQNWVAVDYPGAVRFQLFGHGMLLYTSSFFQPGGVGNFAGLVSSVSFDEVYLYRSSDPNYAFVDDLHWGAPVPGPGVIGLFALFGLTARRRREIDLPR